MHVTKVEKPASLGVSTGFGHSIAVDVVPGVHLDEAFVGVEASDSLGKRAVLGPADIYTYGPHNYVIMDRDVEGTNTLSVESVCCGIMLRSFIMPMESLEYTCVVRVVTV